MSSLSNKAFILLARISGQGNTFSTPEQVGKKITQQQLRPGFAQLGQFCTRMALNRQRIKIPYRTLVVASVLALAYVMKLSCQTITIGTWIAGTRARPKEKTR